MLEAIRKVLKVGIYVSETLAAHLAASFATSRPRGSGTSPLEKLSDREFQVFELFGNGMTAKEIAARLNLSPKTVSVHRDNLKAENGIHHERGNDPASGAMGGFAAGIAGDDRDVSGPRNQGPGAGPETDAFWPVPSA